MALRITPNPRAAGRLSIAANQRARMSSIVSIDWDDVTGKPDVIGDISAGATEGYLLQAHGIGNDATFDGFLQAGTGAATRTWKDKAREWLSAKDFGAVANGTTDNAAAINAAILAAFNSQSASYPGSTVFLPPGSDAYRIASPITLLKGVNLVGAAGMASVILADNCNAINDSAITGFGKQTIRDLYFIGTNPTAARTAINYPGTTDVNDQINGFAVQNCLFRDFDTAINLRSVIHPEITGCWIENVNQGILLSGAAYDGKITGNTIIYASGGGTGGTTFTGISMYSYTYATGGARPPEGNKIANNLVYGFQRGIDADAADTVNIHSNVVVATVYGIRYKDVTALMSITDNNVEMQTTAALIGIWGATPTSSTDTKHSIIQNNVLKTSSGATACAGIQINASGQSGQNDVIIENNFLSEFQGYDIALYNPGGTTKVLNNRCRSSASTNSILVGALTATSTAIVAGNRCAKSIDYAAAADLTAGNTRVFDNIVAAGNEHSTWYVTSPIAALMTFAGPTTSRKTYTLPDVSDTIVTLAATQELDNKTLDSSVAKGTWTVSGTWTLPAFTLGATVSGGGNQINNVIIGTSTPLAGSFTSLAYSTTLTGTSTNASALAVGRQGATDPVLLVDASTASVATGVKVTGAAAAGGVNLAAISSGTNENLTINAKGSGTITLGNSSTGAITLTRATTLSAALTYGGVTLSNAVTGTGSMALSISPTFTGTLTGATGTFGGGGETFSVGPGGTGALNGRINLNGANATGQGALILFTKNLGTHGWFYGHVSAIEGSGTSGDLEYYNVTTTTRTIRLSVTDDTVAFGATTDGTSGTAGAINTLGGIGVTKAIWAGNSIKSAGATHGVGYATGAGGAVTQGTNRTTGVTLNTVSMAVTLFSQVNTAVSAATAQTFTVTNSAVAATDTIIPSQKSGTDKYQIFITNVAAGSFQVTNYSTGGTTNEAPVFNFNLIKGVAS